MFSCSSQRLDRRTPSRPGSPSRCLERSKDEGGYTLLELLVVVLIVGILAAIAIPSFIGQKGKAVDAQAKSLVRSAETTAETISVDNSGQYEKVTTSEVHRYEPAIPIVAGTGGAYLGGATGSRNAYSVTAVATDGDEFTISRNAGGEVTRTCASPLIKTGCGGAATGSW